jgi:hypothetical protein
MSHKHWCDYAGHYWDCSGMATRLFQAQPSECFCSQHGIPIEVGNHSECSVELLSCPEHRADHMIAMGYTPDYVLRSEPERGDESTFRDENGNRTVGFCLWCGCDFYTMEEHEAHVADEMAACLEFQRLKGETCEPPLLEALFGEVEASDD